MVSCAIIACFLHEPFSAFHREQSMAYFVANLRSRTIECQLSCPEARLSQISLTIICRDFKDLHANTLPVRICPPFRTDIPCLHWRKIIVQICPCWRSDSTSSQGPGTTGHLFVIFCVRVEYILPSVLVSKRGCFSSTVTGQAIPFSREGQYTVVVSVFVCFLDLLGCALWIS